MAATNFNFEELVSPVELKLLGAKERGIFFTQEVFGEGEKKNSKDKKKICVSNKRLYILNIQGKPPKLDLSLSLLAISELSSPSPERIVLAYNIDQHSDKAKQVKLEVKPEASVEFLAAILSPLHSTLGKDAVVRRLKVKLQGEGRQEKLDGIVDENVARVSQGCQSGSASEVYALLCDFFDIPFHDEIAWELENTYQTHAIRTLSLNHFDHFPMRDFVPLIRMLEFCPRFEGLSADAIKLCSESFDALIHLSKHCASLRSLSLRGIAGVSSKLAQKLFAQGFATNPACVLEKLDLTDTVVEEKGVESLAASIQNFPIGLRELKLNGTGVSSKNFANFSKHFIKHADIPNTLTLLDFSNNHFSSSSTDMQAFLAFLAVNNRIQELSLAGTNIPFDQLFTALQRGCTMYLTSLNLSGNNKPVIGKIQSTSPAMKQFFQTAVALKQLNLSNCKLSVDFVLQILEGLKENQSIFCLEVNLSQNDLGPGLKEIASAMSGITCIDSLDLSYTSLDSGFEEIIGPLLKSTSIKHLDISGNLKRHKSAAAKVLDESNQDKDCKLESLKINDCRLGDNTSYILHGLIRNNHLKRIELSGNLMGPSSFRQLVKLISNNCVLEAIEFDENLSTVSCIANIASALENNYSIQEMPIHFKDLCKLKKENEREIDAALSKITKLLARNQSPLKRQQALGGIKKRIDLFIAEQQLVLDKKIVELDEEIQLYDISNLTDSRKEIISKANNLKAKAGLVTTLCENFYSSKLETEIGFQLSELINEQTQSSLMPQVISQKEKLMADMLEKLQFSLGDVINEEQIEEIKQNISPTEHQNVFSKDILSAFSDELTASVNMGNLKIVESLLQQTCELVVRELDAMCQQVSNLETSEFPKSPDRNTLGGTCRLKLAFSTSMKRHRVSYQSFNPQFDMDTKSMDSLEIIGNPEQPEEAVGTSDPIPLIIQTNPSTDIPETTQNVQDDVHTEQESTPKQKSKHFAKPKFMTSLKGKKDEKEKKEDKKSKPTKTTRSGSATSGTMVKPDSDLPDISTFNAISKEATLAPDLGVAKSKPRGPPRRPPRRREQPAVSTETAQESSDIFAELATTVVPGLEDLPGADKSNFTLDLSDRITPTEHSDYTEAAAVSKSPPPTSPRKPVGMGPGLASILQAGLDKAKLKASKSHENLCEDAAKEDNIEPRKLSDRTVRKIESHPIMRKPKPLPRPDSKIILDPEDKIDEIAGPEEPQPEPVAKESKPEDKVATESKPEAEVATESKPEAEVATESKPEVEVATESKPEAEVATESKPRAEVATESKPEDKVATVTTEQPEDKLAVESKPEDKGATESISDDKVAIEPQPEDKVAVESKEEDKVAKESENEDSRIIQSKQVDEIATQSTQVDSEAKECVEESNVAPPEESAEEAIPENDKNQKEPMEEPKAVENPVESESKVANNSAAHTTDVEENKVVEATIPISDGSAEKKSMSPPVGARSRTFGVNEQSQSPKTATKPTEGAKRPVSESEQDEMSKLSGTTSPPLNLWDGEIKKSPSVSRKPIITKERIQETKEKDSKSEGADGEGKKPPVITNKPPKPISNKPAIKPLPPAAKPKIPNQSPENVATIDAKEISDEAGHQPTLSDDRVTSPTEQPEIPSKLQNNPSTDSSTESAEILKSPPIREKPKTPSKPKRLSMGNLLEEIASKAKDPSNEDSSKELQSPGSSEMAAKGADNIESDSNKTPPGGKNKDEIETEETLST